MVSRRAAGGEAYCLRVDADSYRAAIVAEGGAVAALPASGLGAPVAACPGWDVERLIGHLGRVHGWAAAAVAAGAEAAGEIDAGPRPPAGEDVLGWYRQRLDALTAELKAHDPEDPAPGFAGVTDVGFWLRRQAQETAVHRWDAQEAITPGGAIPISTTLAADGIDEWASLLVPRALARREGGVPADLVGATLHLHCTDDDAVEGVGEWLLSLTADGAAVERTHAKGDAALRGPAADLQLAVWHRIGLDQLDVVGDAERAEAVLDLIHL